MAKLLNIFEMPGPSPDLYIAGARPTEIFNALASHFTPVMAAGGLVSNRQGEYLLIQRHGLWDLPKGKGEPGESASDTALREVAEECGIAGIGIAGPLADTYHTYRHEGTRYLKRTQWFRMECGGDQGPTPQRAEAITEARWVAPRELPRYLSGTYPSIRAVFRAAGLDLAAAP